MPIQRFLEGAEDAEHQPGRLKNVQPLELKIFFKSIEVLKQLRQFLQPSDDLRFVAAGNGQDDTVHNR